MFFKHFSPDRLFGIFSILLIALSATIFIGCGDDDDDAANAEVNAEGGVVIQNGGDVQLPSAGTFSAKIDGKDWKADVALAVFDEGTFGVSGQAFPGGVNSGQSEQIAIVVQDPKGSGTYALDLLSPHTGNVSLAKTVGGNIVLTVYSTKAVGGKAGEVKVDSLDDKGAKGSFSFKATSVPGGETINVTGSFDVKFEGQ
jgi:hypothetical protein